MTEKANKPSAKPDKNETSKTDGQRFVQRSVARLHAVQAVYGQLINPEEVKLVVNDYLTRRAGMDVEGETLAAPDRALFSKIVQEVEERRADLDDMIKGAMSDEAREPEALLKAILLCGVCEILINPDVDVPVLVNEYLDITHAYYPPGEAKLVNAVLDKVGKILRN
ncbi:MAG: transcription antitermination protein NusB [Alphaproteobacteria bacterium]|nr:transcription antitermination protein NusB [Alphaproteobacteria bacterium]MCD8570851.1 transcription antitermination protein NusB [Alphaproteobacteria bacterium]